MYKILYKDIYVNYINIIYINYKIIEYVYAFSTLLWVQCWGIFLEYAKYTDLEIADITTPEPGQLDLKVINHIDSWEF